MIRLDTLKILIPRAVLQGYDKRKYSLIEETDGKTGKRSEKSRLSKKVIRETCGLGAVEIAPEHVVIEVSAKLLRQSYPAGICLDTIEELPEGLNETGALRVDGAGFLDNAEVLRCDVAENLRVRSVRDSLAALQLLGLNERYHTRPYQGSGVVVSREAKSLRERLIFYDKYGELNHLNRKWLGLGLIDAEPFRGVLRAETNISKFRDIRRLFEVGEPRRLLDVLSSETSPLLEVFTRISEHRLVSGLSSGFEELYAMRGGVAGVRNRLGWIGIFERCGWDWNLVRFWIRGKYSRGSNPSRMVARARAVFNAESRDRGLLPAGAGCLEEIRNLLREAA
jgi:hypothetical protein